MQAQYDQQATLLGDECNDASEREKELDARETAARENLELVQNEKARRQKAETEATRLRAEVVRLEEEASK